jgi:hypothetical protein
MGSGLSNYNKRLILLFGGHMLEKYFENKKKRDEILSNSK